MRRTKFAKNGKADLYFAHFKSNVGFESNFFTFTKNFL